MAAPSFPPSNWRPDLPPTFTPDLPATHALNPLLHTGQFEHGLCHRIIVYANDSVREVHAYPRPKQWVIILSMLTTDLHLEMSIGDPVTKVGTLAISGRPTILPFHHPPKDWVAWVQYKPRGLLKVNDVFRCIIQNGLDRFKHTLENRGNRSWVQTVIDNLETEGVIPPGSLASLNGFIYDEEVIFCPIVDGQFF